MTCEGFTRGTTITWPDDLKVQCPKCGCNLCVEAPNIELDAGKIRILFLCLHWKCGHSWWVEGKINLEKYKPNVVKGDE